MRIEASCKRTRRRMRARLARITIATAIGVAVGALSPSLALAGAVHEDVVARSLDNPRGLAFLPDGRLAVAEAGHAGNVCLGPGQCLGRNGRVTTIGRSGEDRVALATELPSFGGPFGAFGLGGLAVQDGRLFSIVGLNPQAFGSPAEDCQGQPDYTSCVATVTAVQHGAGQLNELRSLSANGGVETLAGVGRFDFEYAAAHPDPGNPEYTPGDANPFGLTAGPSGGFYVVDAASNTLDFVGERGRISVLAFIPDPPNHEPIFDAAPTCAARAPNGDVFVGTESNSLWRWHEGRLTKLLAGGKVGQVIGCVADKRGNVYLANLSSKIGGSFPNFNEKPFDGSIVKVSPDLTTSYIAKAINYPTGLTLGPDGKLYVAINGLCPKDLTLLTSKNATPGGCPESGEVVRLDTTG
jgi:hypothetical protein